MNQRLAIAFGAPRYRIDRSANSTEGLSGSRGDVRQELLGSICVDQRLPVYGLTRRSRSDKTVYFRSSL